MRADYLEMAVHETCNNHAYTARLPLYAVGWGGWEFVRGREGGGGRSLDEKRRGAEQQPGTLGRCAPPRRMPAFKAAWNLCARARATRENVASVTAGGAKA